MNNIFDKLVKSKIEKFYFDYKNLSREIFVNTNGNLIHPGEFGTYREKIIKSLLEPFLPSRLAIGSGFIITSKNNISTQCDLIIYDKNVTPLIENQEQRFFPIECVVGVIEAKSKLTKQTLKESLLKLSDIKKLREDITTNIYVYKESFQNINFNPRINVYDNIGTFLICEKIDDFEIDKDMHSFFKKTYTDVDKFLMHNMILSLDDGCFMYRINTNHIAYPYLGYDKERFKNEIIIPHVAGYDKEHILDFINYFYMIVSVVSVLYLEITNYLGEQRISNSVIE